MSEIKKYKLIGEMVERYRVGGANYVLLADFDRVTAERDGALGREAALREELSTAQRGLANCKLALDAQTHNYGVTNLRLIGAEQRLTAADERADVLEQALRELLLGTGNSPGANKKYGKARAVLEGSCKKADGRICSPSSPHNYHLGECTKCGAISPTE